MKLSFALLLVCLTVSAPFAATYSVAGETPAAQSENPTPETILSAQVAEISSSTTLNHKSQAKLIASAVRVAVIAALEGVKDPAQRLGIALELAKTAAKAAPGFADTITEAVADVPAIARIDGSLDQIKAAVATGVKEADEPETAVAEHHSQHPPTPAQNNGPTGNPIVPTVSPSS